MSAEVIENTETSETNTETNNQSSWLDTIDPAFRADPAISKHESIESLVKDHVNAQSLLGRKGVIIPKEGDTEEVWNAYRESLGVPESPEGYQFESFAPPEGVEWDTDLQNKIQAVAHANNIPASALDQIMGVYAEWAGETVGGKAQSAESKTKENLAELQKELGAAFEASVGLATSAVNQLTEGNSAEVAHLKLADGTMLGDNPAFIKAMAQAGKAMTEKGLLGERPVNNSVMTPAEAQTKLEKFEAENFQALFNESNDPAHKGLVAERDRLLELAYPDNA